MTKNQPQVKGKEQTLDAQIVLSLVEEGKIHEAIERCNQLLKKQRDTDNFTMLGVLYIIAGKYSEAVATLKKAITLAPKNTKAYINLGRAYSQIQQPQKAIQVLENAVLLDVEDSLEIYEMLGQIYLQESELEEAERNANQLLNLDATSPKAHLILGKVMMQRHQNDKAILHFTKVIEVTAGKEEDRTTAYMELVSAYAKKRSPIDAIDCYEMVTHSAPTASIATTTLEEAGSSYLQLGLYEKAAAIYSHLIERQPRYAAPYILKAECLAKQGLYSQAEQQLQAALTLGESAVSFIEKHPELHWLFYAPLPVFLEKIMMVTSEDHDLYHLAYGCRALADRKSSSSLESIKTDPIFTHLHRMISHSKKPIYAIHAHHLLGNLLYQFKRYDDAFDQWHFMHVLYAKHYRQESLFQLQSWSEWVQTYNLWLHGLANPSQSNKISGATATTPASSAAAAKSDFPPVTILASLSTSQLQFATDLLKQYGEACSVYRVNLVPPVESYMKARITTPLKALFPFSADTLLACQNALYKIVRDISEQKDSKRPLILPLDAPMIAHLPLLASLMPHASLVFLDSDENNAAIERFSANPLTASPHFPTLSTLRRHFAQIATLCKQCEALLSLPVHHLPMERYQDNPHDFTKELLSMAGISPNAFFQDKSYEATTLPIIHNWHHFTRQWMQSGS